MNATLTTIPHFGDLSTNFAGEQGMEITWYPIENKAAEYINVDGTSLKLYINQVLCVDKVINNFAALEEVLYDIENYLKKQQELRIFDNISLKNIVEDCIHANLLI